MILLVQVKKRLPGARRLGQGLRKLHVTRSIDFLKVLLIHLEGILARCSWEVGRPLAGALAITNSLDLVPKQFITCLLQLSDQVLWIGDDRIKSLSGSIYSRVEFSKSTVLNLKAFLNIYEALSKLFNLLLEVTSFLFLLVNSFLQLTSLHGETVEHLAQLRIGHHFIHLVLGSWPVKVHQL